MVIIAADDAAVNGSALVLWRFLPYPYQLNQLPIIATHWFGLETKGIKR